eukprot:628163-Amphidinium_carterae.1
MAEIKGDKMVPQAGTPEEAGPSGFQYLLSMKIWTLTEEKLEELKRRMDNKESELDELRKTTCEQMWEKDLDRVLEAVEAAEREEAKEAEADFEGCVNQCLSSKSYAGALHLQRKKMWSGPLPISVMRLPISVAGIHSMTNQLDCYTYSLSEGAPTTTQIGFTLSAHVLKLQPMALL